MACDNTILKPNLGTQCEIHYVNDSIIINHNDSKLRLHLIDGNYYTEEGHLFLSNSVDTVIIFREVSNIWIIKSVSDKQQFSNSCYHIKPNGEAILIEEYSYDNNYNIKGIRTLTTIEYD